MDELDVVLAVESGEWNDEIRDGVSEHRESLRRLQGSWGRFIARLEEAGEI